jgi:murein DD-endopeptidase MepM/ murein hydrolase activator NlpD
VTLLVWLAASSLVWGAVLWGAAFALQSGNELSGRMRQWIWRGAAVLLIMPWLAVPVVRALAPDLSGSVAPPEEFSMAPVLADTPITVTALNMAATDLVERAEPVIAIPWIELIVALVVGGWLLRVVAAGRAVRHLAGIISKSRPGGGASLAIVARWSRMLGLKRAPELRMVSAHTSPFSTGLMNPLVCLPEGIEQSMHAQTLDLVVGHECIHVARGDGWRRPLERSIADIMWFNPFAWAIRRELDLARELACDEAVVAASSQRKAYARTLRVVAGMAAPLPASAPAASMSLSGGGRLLAMRMKRTLDAAARKPAKAAIAGAVMLAFVATPMAIAQAILIEAVQPQETPPAPPAPPAPQAPPSIAPPAAAPEPPAAPAPPSPVDAVAPVASPPAVSAIAPVAPSSPSPRLSPAPRVTPSAVVSPTPVTPVTPRAATAPVTPPTPTVTLPPVALALEPIQFTDGALKLEGAPSIVIAAPGRFTSRYGYRTDPFKQITAFHQGVDIAAPLGTAVHTPGPGVVTFAGTRGEYGRMVEVTLDSDHKVRFGHLNEIVVMQGEVLKAGDVVGTVGSSGPSNGAHLHLEILRNGEFLDPLKVQGLTLTTGPVATPLTLLATPSPLARPLSETSATAVTPLTPVTPAPPAPSEAQAGERTNRKTDLIDIDGKRVASLPLRYDIDGTWVIDNRNVLYRDTSRGHYLVTLNEACKQLDIRRRSFNFFPSWSLRLLASKTYEVRHDTGLGSGGATGQPCDVATIARIDDARANTLRDAAQWRAR